jgi:hypothetical protein
MNASGTMRQAGQSKKMAETRLSFEERACVYVFLALSVFCNRMVHIHVSVLMDRHQDSCTVRQWKIVLSHTNTLNVRCHLYFAIIY